MSTTVEANTANANEFRRWLRAAHNLPALYSTENVAIDDKIVGAKWFGPGRYTYYATEYEAETKILFGYCLSPLGPDCDEWGYQSLDEWASVTGPYGIHLIELDRHFTPVRFGDLDIPKRF
jgi:hypothetical protein